MGLLVAKKDEVVILMPDSQLDTNTSPEAEKMLMDQLDVGETVDPICECISLKLEH